MEASNTGTGKETAIVAITRRGVELGCRLRDLLSHSELYLPERFACGELEHPFTLPVSHLIRDIFGKCRHLVLIMAVGAAVRLVAPVLTDKRRDPGVVVIDDSGRFAVSLVSGHVGGANELAARIAALLGAQPVITTASENRGASSLDLVAKSFGWEVEDRRTLTRVSAALVNGEPVGVFQDAGETDWSTEELSAEVRVFPDIEALRHSDCRAGVVVTDRLVDSVALSIPVAIFRPRSLVVGIGCNRGTECVEIGEVLDHVLAEHGLSKRCVRNLATIDTKKNETGLVQFAAENCLPVEYFDRESLSKVSVPSPPSALALQYVGTPAVCEAAAILSGGAIIVPKTGFKRKITLAVARLSFEKMGKAGKLFLVGIGPGDPEHMTLRARQTIARSDVVVGYQAYIDLIKPFISQKEVVTTGMGKEVARVNRAVELASRGKVVSLVSSGDSGVYGMAALVGEIMREHDGKLSVEVVPGVPAMIAAGALLGTPLSGDVAYISLSNYLVPWEEIVGRLHAAAQGDFVIALYNPRSTRRRRQLEESREIVLQYRSRTTPVGVVTNAYRAGESVVITDLEHLLDQPVDMNTIVIIGNSTTSVCNDWMVTPRGYGTKYRLREEESP